MAKITIVGPSSPMIPMENERPESRSEMMDRQGRDIDYANMTGLPYQKIIGEGGPATVVESEVDTSGPSKQRIYKPRSESSIGPTNDLKGQG